jgi:peptidoglycan biosynthesis protein MviN/MurJ (putative lipid II flippase)
MRRMAPYALPALSAFRIVGAVAVEFAIIWRFGVGSQTDTYFTTVAFPWVASRAVAAAAPVALVPALRRAQGRLSATLASLTGLAAIAALVLGTAMVAALWVGALLGPVQLLGTLALTLALAHSIAVSGEIIKPYLIAAGQAELALVSDAVQAVVAVAGVILLGEASSIQGVGAVVLASYATQLVVLALFSGRISRRLGGARFRLVELWTATKQSLLMTFGATAARRLTVPTERHFGSLSGIGHATAVAYAGQITNAMASVLGTFTTNSLLPFLSGQRTPTERRTVLVAYVTWLAEIGAVVSFASASVAVWILLFEPILATEAFRPVVVATAITLLSLPGMLVVQALLSVHYARGDGATPTRHLLLTLAVHMGCLLIVRNSFGVAGIAACWFATGIYSVIRAIRITRPVVGEELLTSAETRSLLGRLCLLLATVIVLTALGGALAGWRGAGIGALLVAAGFAASRGKASLLIEHIRAEGRRI